MTFIKRYKQVRGILGWIIKGAILLVILFFASAICSPLVPLLRQDPPDINKAHWIVQTSSRLYYTNSVISADGSPAITDYWYSDGKGYKFVDGVKKPSEVVNYKYENGKWYLIFKKSVYGQVAVVRRAE